ncbi:MAG: ubiquinone-binding protein [Kordiimonas sp.]|nr:ubiquinone-binding protein [Kordiimonas sp.]|tara:strand:- start:802 stop:1242 length:441 start_codon:yes stop_codon:yes gene_type:complete
MPQHKEVKVLPYTSQQLFDLVSDVEKYPEFLPWCLGSRILRRQGNSLHADLVIGFKLFRERFTSHVTFSPNRIDVEYVKGPLQYLQNRWIFDENEDGSTTVDFMVDFEFKNKMFEKLVGSLFTEAVHRMVKAFEDRAAVLYGDTSV